MSVGTILAPLQRKSDRSNALSSSIEAGSTDLASILEQSDLRCARQNEIPHGMDVGYFKCRTDSSVSAASAMSAAFIASSVHDTRDETPSI